MFTQSSPTHNANVAAYDTNAKLDWYSNENRKQAQQDKLFRTAQEEEEMQLILRPRSIPQSYGLLGLTLGTFPPAAIFTKLFGNNILTATDI